MTAPVHESVKQKSASAHYAPPRCQPPVELTRRPVHHASRKHPPYGADLAANPPPPDESLRVLVGWEYAQWVTENRIVLVDSESPDRLRFDVAAGRRVRVDHPHDADPERLLHLAQALIDYGATVVDLVIPFCPGALSTQMLRIVPRPNA